MKWIEMVCISCGVPFQIPQATNEELLRTKRSFLCINGHGQSYTGDVKEIELQKEIERLKNRPPKIIERELASVYIHDIMNSLT